ncbi:amino acid ABC transporter ATP-binding protein [Cryptosporangium aurantiacum]|uniref:Amino acid ABC transporter ATP-binding protein, PAAT family n=1 Tax=Cryptosporangium aurantiacum TaxID=134849 RepID=A0A1M7RJI6_9ACTN|nr:amino acid ABC transporter ATP-binding protein [Cryptosporangium aurantiacum]SHN46329.1 amino acid ABC transporter ATP-binding protein, PAAT family [Cryptosporangium aurantiacum]
MTNAAVVRVSGATKTFGPLRVLDRVDLELHSGEVVVLIGPSGSGKSTFCRCVNGLERLDAGTVEISGDRLSESGPGLAAVRRRVGFIFQQFNLFPHLSVLDNVTLAPRLVNRVPRADAEDAARGLLVRVGLADKAGARPGQLSGGQQQRVAIARALAMEPDVLLFDEPTSALDPQTTYEVVDVMEELATAGTTMLVVTHEMGFARRAADRVAFMDGGRIVEVAPPAEFFAAPTSERARTFLSHVLPH